MRIDRDVRDVCVIEIITPANWFQIEKLILIAEIDFLEKLLSLISSKDERLRNEQVCDWLNKAISLMTPRTLCFVTLPALVSSGRPGS